MKSMNSRYSKSIENYRNVYWETHSLKEKNEELLKENAILVLRLSRYEKEEEIEYLETIEERLEVCLDSHGEDIINRIKAKLRKD